MRTECFKELFYSQNVSEYSTLGLIALAYIFIDRYFAIEIINIVLSHIGASPLLRKYSAYLLKVAISKKYYEVLYSLSKYLDNLENAFQNTPIQSTFYRTFVNFSPL
jgi:hypothetical protein